MKFSYCFLPALFMAAAFCSATARAAPDGTCVHQAAPAGARAKRIAIVVGDGAYAHGIPVLPNPVNDAQATAKAMTALSFETWLSTDASSASLQQCLDQAYAGAADAEVAMFYYSGHGIQIADENYLVATDATTGDLKRGFVAVQPIVDALQKRAKATLVLLDACRNNPLAEDGHAGLSVSTGRGLAKVKDASALAPAKPDAVQARGLMVAYSTSPNAVARDGTGHLSPFSDAFVKTVGTSGYSIQHVMSDVTKSVGEATQWEQTPWMKSSLTNELKLGGGETLEEAKSISDNHAARSSSLLDTDANRSGAIVEALKGLPASPDEAALKRFAKAYLALYFAVQGGEIVLPVTPGMTQVAISPRDRAALFRRSEDFRSGTFTLWSISEQKVIAKPDVGRGGASEKFAFSPHGKLLAAVLGGTTAVFDGLDGTKLFELRGRASSVEFSPDESRLMLEGDNRITIVDIASRKPTMVLKASQLDPDLRALRSAYLSQVMFAGNDKLCFAFTSATGGKGALGVYDFAQGKTVRVREVDQSVYGMKCDPAGKYMVRTFVAGEGDGMEIWDLTNDKVSRPKAPVTAILAMDPKGRYVSVLASPSDAQGFYDLATGEKAYPPTVPDGYWILGARVRDTHGGLVSQDVNNNPWRDWPDESLFGPALVKRALTGLSPAQREEVDRERITYAVIAGNP